MPKSKFRSLNKERIEKGLKAFANPRNAAAGMMRQLDPRKVAGKSFQIVFYEILSMSGPSLSNHENTLEFLRNCGLRTTAERKIAEEMEDIRDFHNWLSEKREVLEYEIDGLVIKLDDHDLRRKLGVRSRDPRWALAWKFPPRKEITTLKEIVISVGRTGILTPVALLDPVEVGGVTVSRAGLHNEDEARKKDVRPGDRVKVARAGDVIPEIMEVVEKAENRPDKFEMPKNCPVCDSEIVKEGAYHICPAGLSCSAQASGKIEHYASKNAMDIEGLGEKTVDEMVEKAMVKDIADLYALSKKDFLKLEGFAEKSATKLYNAIQGAKNPGLDQFLYSLGIRHVGRRTALLLAKNYRDFDSIVKAEQSELEKIDEIGPEIAGSVSKFFRSEENLDVIQRLFVHGVKIKKKRSLETKTNLEGKIFVFTGSLENYTRKEVKGMVEQVGAKASSSVSGNTDYLVVGKNPGQKCKQAQKNDVKILEEKEFEILLK